MDFQKVTFDTELDSIEDDDELRGLVRDFIEAQEQNITEFEQAHDEIESLEGSIAEFKDADSELAEEVADVTFLSMEEAEALDFSRKREIIEEAEFSEEEDEDEEEEEENFDDMGKHGATHDEDEVTSEFAEKYVGSINGLELSD